MSDKPTASEQRYAARDRILDLEKQLAAERESRVKLTELATKFERELAAEHDNALNWAAKRYGFVWWHDLEDKLKELAQLREQLAAAVEVLKTVAQWDEYAKQELARIGVGK